MVDLTYRHGVTVVESPDTPSLLRIAKQGVTFVNGPAPQADNAAFPLGMTLVTSLSQAALLGDGYLKDAVTTVFNEGGSYAIVNRVEDSEDPATLEANLLGDATLGTGIYAATKAKAKFGLTPRVLITAGDTGKYIEDGAVSVVLVSAGSSLTEAPAAEATGGGTDPGKVLPTLQCIMGTGADADKVASVKIVTPGKKLTSAVTVTFTGGGSDENKVLPSATVNLGDVAGPYISALATVAEKIKARAYVEGPSTTNAEAVRWRKTINSGRILPIDPKGVKNVAGAPVTVPVAPVFAGIRSRVVASAEGVSGSVSNKLIRTLDGVARTVIYPDESNYLNENQVATIINERGGLRTWGSRLAIDDPIWQFDSVRATADMINESLEDLFFVYVDRKFTKHNLKMMVEDGNAALRVFRLNQDILGGRVWLSDLNEPTLNANGKVFLDVEFEPVGLMEQIHVTTYRNTAYYRVLLDEVRGLVEQGPLVA